MAQITDRLASDIYEHIREVERLEADAWIPFEDMTSHISRSGAKLDNVSVGLSELFNFGEDQVKELQPWFSWHKATRPTTNKLVIMKFMLCSNKSGHFYAPECLSVLMYFLRSPLVAAPPLTAS